MTKLYILPTLIHPKKDAVNRIDCKGFYNSISMPRLVESSIKLSDKVFAEWSTYFDLDKKVVIKGNASCDCFLECIRCLKPYSFKLFVNFKFSPIKKFSKDDNIDSRYEPVLFNEFGEINILEAIEEEFLLHLPLMPTHDIDECDVRSTVFSFGDDLSSSEKIEKNNPFAVLKELKTK